MIRLPEATLGEEVAEDYLSLRLSLKAHPLALIRDHPGRPLSDCVPAAHLAEAADGAKLAVAGLVLVRQRPGSAKGVIFATLEDETGVANIVVWTDVFERFRRPLLGARLMRVAGRLQREGIVTHLVAERIEDRSNLLETLMEPDSGRVVHTPDFRGTGYHPPSHRPVQRSG